MQTKPAQENAESASRVRMLWHFLKSIVFILLFLGALIWTSLGIRFLDQWLPEFVAIVAASAFVFLSLVGLAFQRMRKTAASIVAIGYMGVVIFYTTLEPRSNRPWQLEHQTMPQTTFSGSSATIHGVRNFQYDSEGNAVPQFSDINVDLDSFDSLWFGVDRFTTMEAMAHTFLSFGFRDSNGKLKYVSVSVETRREQHEKTYSPLRGMFRNYELIYVIAEEKDVLSLRTDVRQHPVQLYPVRAKPHQIKRMFLDITRRANGLIDQPEFYNTLTSNCTNNLVYHANNISDWPISMFERGVLFPGYSDWLTHRHGLIDTSLSLEEARETFRIDQKARDFSELPDNQQSDFSGFIRADTTDRATDL